MMVINQKSPASLSIVLLNNEASDDRLSAYVQHIKSDVESMLNCHRSTYQWPAGYDQLDRSVLSFGLPNYWLMSASSHDARMALCRDLKRMMMHNEPRIQRIKVEVMNEPTYEEFIIYLSITGVIRYQGGHENIVLESKMNPLTKSFRIL